MIDTRSQMLTASYELHKFYYDCKETLERINVSDVTLERINVSDVTLERINVSDAGVH